MKKPILKTRRGGASMFIVMFTVIILSIITLSFTRVVLAEVLKTSNTDLSQSAYDSALAGVEDAKVALLKYHACLDNGNTATSGSSECRRIIKAMQDGIRTRDCSTVSNVLGRDTNEEEGVVVQETQHSSDEGNNTSMLQSYTCVTIKEELEDYRTTLSSQSRLRIIPIRSADIDSIGYIRLQWFSDTNFSQIKGNDRYCSSFLYSLGGCSNSTQAPTTLNVRLIQTDSTFNISELSTSIAANRTDTGQLMLIPSNGGGSNYINADAWGESANKADNKPNKINCSRGTWFCRVDIQLPRTFRNNLGRNDATTYLLVSIPYGNPETDISVMTFTNQGTDNQYRRDFSGVQARVDSTGRANDLYRRVETRVELVDTYFAYPEFEITLTNSENDTLNKTFYATFDCWGSDDGTKEPCLNSMENLTYTNL